MTYLGIDLGTSGLRALLVDESGSPIGATERSYAVSHPKPGWSEQDPGHWIAALEDAVAELNARFPAFRRLAGIGVAGHMHGATLVDHAGGILRPCILWNDTRSEHEAARLDALSNVRSLSGNIVFPGFTAPKLEWVRAHEPEVFERIYKVLLPAAYLNHYLTGEFVTDMSDASGTSWLDVGARAWSETLLAAGHMNETQMPQLVEGCQKAGILRSDLRKKWGLSDDVTVAGGAGDNAAAACGIGALNEGEGFVSIGTSGVVLVARETFSPMPETAVHTFCHAVPDRWYQMGVMLSATDSLNWLSNITGLAPAELTDALERDVLPPGRIRFLPYLSGERTPHNDAGIRGCFTGLSTNTSRDDLTRAVLEGVAFGLRDSLEALRATGARIENLCAIGGGAASQYWLQLIANTLGVSLKLPEGREFGAALGAARLAIVAASGSRPEDAMPSADIGQVIEPNRETIALFDDAYHGFRGAYDGVRQIQ